MQAYFPRLTQPLRISLPKTGPVFGCGQHFYQQRRLASKTVDGSLIGGLLEEQADGG